MSYTFYLNPQKNQLVNKSHLKYKTFTTVVLNILVDKNAVYQQYVFHVLFNQLNINILKQAQFLNAVPLQIVFEVCDFTL